MATKLKLIEKLLIVYILLIYFILFIGCKTKKVENTHTDSLFKEVVTYHDSINTKTIFEYETIFDTIHKVYVTNIKKIIVQESQNKSLQATKDVKVTKNTEKIIKEPTKSKNGLWNYILVAGFVGIFFLGLWIKK